MSAYDKIGIKKEGFKRRGYSFWQYWLLR